MTNITCSTKISPGSPTAMKIFNSLRRMGCASSASSQDRWIPMVKSQLIRRVALTFRLQYSSHIQKSVEVMLDEISAALVNKGRVELRGFGFFATRRMPARFAVNPQTGASVHAPKTIVVHFKNAKAIKEHLNPEGRS